MLPWQLLTGNWNLPGNGYMLNCHLVEWCSQGNLLMNFEDPLPISSTILILDIFSLLKIVKRTKCWIDVFIHSSDSVSFLVQWLTMDLEKLSPTSCSLGLHWDTTSPPQPEPTPLYLRRNEIRDKKGEENVMPPHTTFLHDSPLLCSPWPHSHLLYPLPLWSHHSTTVWLTPSSTPASENQSAAEYACSLLGLTWTGLSSLTLGLSVLAMIHRPVTSVTTYSQIPTQLPASLIPKHL